MSQPVAAPTAVPDAAPTATDSGTLPVASSTIAPTKPSAPRNAARPSQAGQPVARVDRAEDALDVVADHE